MRYADLRMKYAMPNVWKYIPPGPERGRTYDEVRSELVKFGQFKGTMKNELSRAICEPINNSETEEEIGTNLDPVLDRLSKSFFCSDNVNQDLLLKKANKNTLNKKLQNWCSQLNHNAPLVRKTPGFSIFRDHFKNVPAVVVCAGPSLGNNIEQLRELKGKALIMSTDTAFRSLAKRGIDPDFVNAHDANPQGARFFDGIDTKAVGLFVNYVSPLTIRAFRGEKSFYYVGDSSLSVYQTMALACDSESRSDGSFLKSHITGGSSVAHTALYACLAMGCNPVTFVGLDLSYPDLDKSHFETDNPKNPRAQKLIDVYTVQGKKVKTNLSFYSYKTVLDRMTPYVMMQYNSELFTSTEDEKGEPTGIVHVGLRPLALRHFAERYASFSHEKLSNIMEVYKQYGTSKINQE